MVKKLPESINLYGVEYKIISLPSDPILNEAEGLTSWYPPDGPSIRIKSTMSDDQKICTLFHEVYHIALKESGLSTFPQISKNEEMLVSACSYATIECIKTCEEQEKKLLDL